jgi:hypothetical protein
LSSAVVKISERFVGIVVLRSMSLVMMPPLVSMPRDSGVTSSSRTSLTSPLSTPACRLAPTATTSSGLTPLLGSLPPVSSRTMSTRRACAWSRRPGPRGRSRDGDAGVLDDVLERRAAALEQVTGDALELGRGQRLVEEQRVPVGVDRDVGQVDRGLLGRRQLDLRLLRGLADALHRHLVLGEVDAVRGLEAVDEPVDDLLVPVVAAEVVVTAGGLDLDDALADLEEGHVEGAAAEVEDEDRLVLLALVEAVGERQRRWAR